MFDMNPLNFPDAQLQQAIMLFVAGTLGFFISYASHRQLIRQLTGNVATLERDIDNLNRTPVSLSGNDETAILNRVRARAGELNFDRIGLATPAEADNLKVISGVGPFLERKLNAIGIYTYRQIANFSKEDVELVNDIIEFFPGRIQRDNWVGQATELVRPNR